MDSERNALQEHLSKAARIKARKIRSGELPKSAAGGRPATPTACERCGETQPSARAAWMHCRTGGKGGRPRKTVRDLLTDLRKDAKP